MAYSNSMSIPGITPSVENETTGSGNMNNEEIYKIHGVCNHPHFHWTITGWECRTCGESSETAMCPKHYLNKKYDCKYCKQEEEE